jgi:hypothetical protein
MDSNPIYVIALRYIVTSTVRKPGWKSNSPLLIGLLRYAECGAGLEAGVGPSNRRFAVLRLLHTREAMLWIEARAVCESIIQ